MRILPAPLLLLSAALVLYAVQPPRPSGADDGAPAPDYGFYKARIAPIVHGNCAECHAKPRKRLGRHYLRPPTGRKIRERDHERNFETILKLIERGNPAGSVWLLKPLGPRQGGVEHGGGERIRMGDLAYGAMVDFINGATLPAASPAPATGAPPPTPLVEAEGRTWQAESLPVMGDASVGDDPQADSGRLVEAGENGGEVELRFRTAVAGVHRLTLRVRGPGTGLAWTLDDAEPVVLDPVEPGFSVIGKPIRLDGSAPLLAVHETLALEEGVARLEGRSDAPAAFLLPSRVEHSTIEAGVRLPDEEDGGDDALLLFDMDDLANGKYLGLSDGGRRVVMGVLEGGRPRVLDSARAPEARADDTGVRHLEVRLLEGVAVGRVDGRSLVFLHLGETPGVTSGRVGFMTHGAAAVVGVRLSERFTVHEAAFREAPVVTLPAGPHRLRVRLPAGAPALDALTIRPLGP